MGLTGAALREYFDTEKGKLKEEEERQARREYEKRKDADERRIAALKKEIAALESRIRLTHPADTSSTPVHVLIPTPSNPANCSVPAQRELGLQALETQDDSAEGPEEEKATGSMILKAHTNNGREVIIPRELTAASEIFSCSQKMPRKRKRHRKTAIHPAITTSVCTSRCRRFRKRPCPMILNNFGTRRLPELSRKNSNLKRRPKRFLRGLGLRGNELGICYAGRPITIRSWTPRKTTLPKHSRQRIKIRRKMREKARSRKKRVMLIPWQYSPVLKGSPIHQHSTKRRKKGSQGVFHSRGSCSPKRKRRRIF